MTSPTAERIAQLYAHCDGNFMAELEKELDRFKAEVREECANAVQFLESYQPSDLDEETFTGICDRAARAIRSLGK